MGAHRSPATSRAKRALASVSTRTHTLVLTGELNSRSSLTLEAEMERLYEDGVTDITLDLRELTYIDAIGVAVIAFRSGLSARRGFGFALIAGPPHIHDIFVQAGVAESLPFREVAIR
jgi:anti-anti-sigma factor